ncbi:MAG: ComEC/Rec2 family competence protein [Planctomycetes bacterium]|nr:ComEC/Rec2 family competence protein [Planctomycetota bacterium]
MSTEQKATSWPAVGFSLRLSRTAPLLPVAGGVIAGVLIDNAARPPREIYLICFGLLCLAAIPLRIRMRFGILVVALASATAGAVRHADAYRVISPIGIERYTADFDGGRRLVRLQGTVVAQPRLTKKSSNRPFARWAYRADRTTFLLDVVQLEGESGDIGVSGRIRVNVHDAVLDLQPEDRVEILGWLYAHRGPRNPGSFDWATYLRRHGVVAGLSCNLRQNIKRLSTSRPHRHGVLQACRQRISDLLTDTTAIDSQDEAGLLEAILLGRRSRVSRELNEAFIRAGCAHFLAVSGVHIVIVMILARFLAGKVFKAPQLRIVAVLMTVVAYTVLAEPRPPILRAGTMAALYCVAQLMGRSRSYLNWISAAAVVLVLANPTTVFDAGFQLTFSAVLGVAYLAPAMRCAFATLTRSNLELRTGMPSAGALAFSTDDHKGPWRRIAPLVRQRWRRFIHNLGFGFAVSLAAWLAGASIVAAHFERLQPWGPLNSLVVFPLVGIVMLLGLLKVIAAPLLPSLGEFIGRLLFRSERVLIDFVAFLGDLPGANLTIHSVPWWWTVSFYLLLAMFVWRFRDNAARFFHRDSPSESSAVASRRWVGRGTVFAALLVCVSTVVWVSPAATGRRVVVTALSVGAGSATVIQLPSGETLLYDAGSASPFDVGRSTIVPFLRSRGISRIDDIFISHPNLDHFSGIPSILQEMDAGPIHINEYFGDLSPPGSPSRHLLQLLSEQGHEVRVEAAGTAWTYADVRLERLWPPGDGTRKLSPNDSSWVLRLSYLGHSVLLTGDIEELPLRELAQRDDIHADVLFLPHHGGVRPSLPEFLEAVSPRVLVQSSHRRTADTVSGLVEIVGHRPLFNTADIGAVEIVLDESGVHVSTPATESYQLSVISGQFRTRTTDH